MHNVSMCEYSSLPQAIDILRPELSRDDRDFAAWRTVRDDPATYFASPLKTDRACLTMQAAIAQLLPELQPFDAAEWMRLSRDRDTYFAALPGDITQYEIAPRITADYRKHYRIHDAARLWHAHAQMCADLGTPNDNDQHPPGTPLYKYAAAKGYNMIPRRIAQQLLTGNNVSSYSSLLIKMVTDEVVIVACDVAIVWYTNWHLTKTIPNTYSVLYYIGRGRVAGSHGKDHDGGNGDLYDVETDTLLHAGAHVIEVLPCGLVCLQVDNVKVLTDFNRSIPIPAMYGMLDDTGTALPLIKPFHARAWPCHGEMERFIVE